MSCIGSCLDLSRRLLHHSMARLTEVSREHRSSCTQRHGYVAAYVSWQRPELRRVE